MDSASSSPSSRRTIIVRFAHGHARATTSRYRPACAGNVPSRPSAVIRSSRYRVSRTNSPEVLTQPTLSHPPAPAVGLAIFLARVARRQSQDQTDKIS